MPFTSPASPNKNVKLSRGKRAAHFCILCGGFLIVSSVVTATGSRLLASMRGTANLPVAQSTEESAVPGSPDQVQPPPTSPQANNPGPASANTASTIAASPKVASVTVAGKNINADGPRLGGGPRGSTQGKTVQDPGGSLAWDDFSNPINSKARAEIVQVYSAWKRAWGEHDVPAMMSLYSKEIRFRDVSGALYEYATLHGWYQQLWGSSSYRLRDVTRPRLVITGDRAVLIVGQSYSRRRRLRLTSRYILHKELVTISAAPASANKAANTKTTKIKVAPPPPLPRKVKKWLIVHEDFLPFQGSSDVEAQIY